VPTIGVQHCLRTLTRNIQEAQLLLQEARSFRIILPNGNARHIGTHRVELLAGLALLRMHLSWEDFIESVFVRYMCGAKSASGFSPTLILSPEPNIVSATATLLHPTPTHTYLYLNWNVKNISSWASRHFFHGEPFALAIGAFRQTLEDISAVRNVFAHRSTFAIGNFHALVLREIGYVPRGTNPGRFLLTNHPSHTPPQRFIDLYADALLNAAGIIVP